MVAAVTAAFILGIDVGHYWNTDTLENKSPQSTESTQSSGYAPSTGTMPEERPLSESEIKTAAIAAAKKALNLKKGSSWTNKIDTETS